MPKNFFRPRLWKKNLFSFSCNLILKKYFMQPTYNEPWHDNNIKDNEYNVIIPLFCVHKGNILFPSQVIRKLCIEFKSTKINPDKELNLLGISLQQI